MKIESTSWKKTVKHNLYKVNFKLIGMNRPDFYALSTTSNLKIGDKEKLWLEEGSRLF